MTYQVSIINPKADKLLQDLADMGLILIQQEAPNQFLDVVARLRDQADGRASLQEITDEINKVRK